MMENKDAADTMRSSSDHHNDSGESGRSKFGYRGGSCRNNRGHRFNNNNNNKGQGSSARLKAVSHS